jgi:hypothetical protein
MLFRFSPEGVKQVELDVTAGIFPILAEFSPCPEAHFHRLMVNPHTLKSPWFGALLWIRDILIRIRTRSPVPLTIGSGSGSGYCHFRP